MSDIFNENIKKALENAQRLKIVGEHSLCKKMCIETVKKVSVYNKVDLIKLFYGASAYDRIKDPADAAKYIFISKCLTNVYDAIAFRKSVNSELPWATVDLTTSDEHVKEFFVWLRQRERSVETEDSARFKSFLKAVENYDRIRFKMTERVKSFSLVEIIERLVTGGLTITNNGVLQ